jgi:phosphate butyryltransferase
MIKNFDELLEHARSLGKRRVVVAAAHNEAALSAVIDAQQLGLTEPILVGKAAVIQEMMQRLSAGKPEQCEIIDEPNDKASAQKAVQFIREGKGDILLKGGMDTSTLMKAVLDSESGLRTGRLLSDVFIFEYPARPENKLVMITDGGVTLNPDWHQKIELIQNAVEVAHALGNDCPKVALLSATEMVNPNLPSTLDAAILSKMNQRGQIKGCVVDGPLTLDNAISMEAVQEKKIDSPVAGQADILVAPNIETANIFAKSTTYFAGFRLGHIIVGAKAPILIPSRADKKDAKLLSIALGVLMSFRQR